MIASANLLHAGECQGVGGFSDSSPSSDLSRRLGAAFPPYMWAPTHFWRGEGERAEEGRSRRGKRRGKERAVVAVAAVEPPLPSFLLSTPSLLPCTLSYPLPSSISPPSLARPPDDSGAPVVVLVVAVVFASPFVIVVVTVAQ